MPQRTSKMRPSTRRDQGQPICGMRDWSNSGKRMPPKLPPTKAAPLARPRRVLNQWATQPLVGLTRREVPVAVRMEKERMIW